MTKKRIARTATKVAKPTRAAQGVPVIPPRPEFTEDLGTFLDTIDRALLTTIAGTVGREGAGADAYNLAVAVKASMDLRSMLSVGGAS